MTERKGGIAIVLALVVAPALLGTPALSQGAPVVRPAAVAPAVAPAQATEALKEGKPVERTLALGEVHNYALELPGGRSVKLLLEKSGVAAVATVFAPDGNKLGVFGSAASAQGSEEIAFVADAAGSYKIAVRTFFKPSPPGRYRLTLAAVDQASEREKLGQARLSCQEKNWLDSDNNFVVDVALASISGCLNGVAQSLKGKYPTALDLAREGTAELNYLTGRWRWGEFVSPAYQESLTEDLRALAAGVEKQDPKFAWGALQEVVRDIKVKAAHCRQSNRGLGGDVKVKVVTRREGAEVRDRFVFYKRCLYKYSKASPNRFAKLSPVSSSLPPSIYIMWAGKSEAPPELKHDPACFPVQGEQEQQIDIPAP